jgi:LmbE family N-acetylglucosaminyl deacetylase
MNPTVTNNSLLTNPQAIPLHCITEILAGSVLIVAPHPDDETLGCGGAITLLRSLGKTVNVLVMSDGTQSHPNSRQCPALALKNLREAETRCAMATLGVEDSHITFFQLPDGAIPQVGSPSFEAAVFQCHSHLVVARPNIIFVPWRLDPHPDHRATWQIVRAAIDQAALGSRVLEYPIWDWDSAQRQLSPQGAIQAWRLDITAVVEVKQQAIAAYRSQTTDLINDDPAGFRLTPQMLSNFAQPWEVYLEET